MVRNGHPFQITQLAVDIFKIFGLSKAKALRYKECRD